MQEYQLVLPELWIVSVLRLLGFTSNQSLAEIRSQSTNMFQLGLQMNPATKVE